MIADHDGTLTIRQMNMDVLGTDREVIEHRPVLSHSGPVARIVTDGRGPAGGDYRRTGGAEADTFCRRGPGCGGTKTGQFLAQCDGVNARSSTHLYLELSELARHGVTQTCAGPGYHGLGGRARGAADRVDE
jgi:hypothetical protein